MLEDCALMALCSCSANSWYFPFFWVGALGCLLLIRFPWIFATHPCFSKKVLWILWKMKLLLRIFHCSLVEYDSWIWFPNLPQQTRYDLGELGIQNWCWLLKPRGEQQPSSTKHDCSGLRISLFFFIINDMYRDWHSWFYHCATLLLLCIRAS